MFCPVSTAVLRWSTTLPTTDQADSLVSAKPDVSDIVREAVPTSPVNHTSRARSEMTHSPCCRDVARQQVPDTLRPSSAANAEEGVATTLMPRHFVGLLKRPSLACTDTRMTLSSWYTTSVSTTTARESTATAVLSTDTCVLSTPTCTLILLLPSPETPAARYVLPPACWNGLPANPCPLATLL